MSEARSSPKCKPTIFKLELTQLRSQGKSVRKRHRPNQKPFDFVLFKRAPDARPLVEDFYHFKNTIRIRNNASIIVRVLGNFNLFATGKMQTFYLRALLNRLTKDFGYQNKQQGRQGTSLPNSPFHWKVVRNKAI